MKLLLLSDLHGRTDWYAWVRSQKADVTAIAGDLLDAFHPSGLLTQMISIKGWVDEFEAALALCSGNQDFNVEGGAVSGGKIDLPDGVDTEEARGLILADHWMDLLEREKVITDRRSQLLKSSDGQLVVTTLPYDYGDNCAKYIESLWEQGSALREASGSPWLVLHHEPPRATLVGGQLGSGAATWMIRKYQPEWVLSGHLHRQPYRGSFSDQIGRSWCFNPGSPEGKSLETDIPNHIVLDTKVGIATWYAGDGFRKEEIHRRIRLG